MKVARLFVAFTLACLLAVASSADRAAAGELSSEEKADGFVSLFDGKTLAGWTGDVAGYEVIDGAIVCSQKKGGNLFTDKEYTDFVLRLDVKIPEGGNNGIGIRAPLGANAAFAGMELQVIDDPAEVYKNIKDWQHHGSVYGVVAAKTGSLKPAGEWNVQEVTVQGRRVKVVCNGQTIVDADLDEATKNGTLDGKEHPGVKNAKGHVGFLGHGAPVAFRNIRIKELPAK